MRDEIRKRLIKYLERDKKGIRREVLTIFLDGNKYTTIELYERLREKGYEINPRGVSAMVGLINTRLGILKMEMSERNKYYLKPEYIDLVRNVLEEY
jgi:hypothetical protein